MINPVSQYFRCAGLELDLELSGSESPTAGYFRFGPGVTCYGRETAGLPSPRPDGPLHDVLNDVVVGARGLRVPFDPMQIVDNLHNERYLPGSRQAESSPWSRFIHTLYYSFRPLLPLAIRKHFQKIHLQNWQQIPFPQWPVDRTVDVLMQRLLLLSAKSQKVDRVPFIWFWPDGANACSIMTHDVEAEPGKQFCSTLMGLDEQFDIPASFQIVPEKRYKVEPGFLDEIKARGFEVDVQDLNHDGRLFRDHEEFSRRAKKINQYAKDFGAIGFRSAILYRNQDWFNLLNFSYDMSVPNVAHLDPQRGGCCTVMPYFIGNMVELPVTTTQDHSLFNILNDYSLRLWQQQVELIMKQHGLISFIVHPDYIVDSRPQNVYKQLLEFLSRLRADKNVWVALPREVDQWWRQRAQMKIVYRDGKWLVEGTGHERACVAFACLDGDQIVYEFQDSLVQANRASN